ncbi:hypothetical protein BS50DRAFT_572177 [Corynespora cassiicola Philippines]|uniref:Uncharacterized protein n=1 Tax=Corynespora cassiicola Philippines TaxID=1448308 RepID=A0A2T2NV76_CORCC|nr:hypothetical protein BS50DRAFT_572177 [Corynespora cassiicola Philippines]
MSSAQNSSSGSQRPTGRTGGGMNRYPCVNALAEGHPSNYYWVEGSNNLCVHCQSAPPR